MELICSSEAFVLMRAAWLNIPEDGMLFIQVTAYVFISEIAHHCPSQAITYPKRTLDICPTKVTQSQVMGLGPSSVPVHKGTQCILETLLQVVAYRRDTKCHLLYISTYVDG
jgi:hypothetical protein